MRNRFTGAMMAATAAAVAAAVSLTVMPLSGQAPAAGQGRAQGAGAAGQGRGQAAPAARPAAAATPRPARIAGHPNINGIYQSITTANWNLEDHPAQATKFWELGAIGAIPAGMSLVEGG